MRALIYTSSGYALAFWLAFLIWVVPETVGSKLQRATGMAVRQDRGSQTVLIGLLWVSLIVAFSAAGLFHGASITWHRMTLFYLGVVFMLLGVALRWWSIRVLGRYFTREVAVWPDQRVVERGPYRFVRHPAYSGTLLTMLGIGLALTNWVSLAAIMLCNLAGHLYRVHVEERALSTALGQPYRDYTRRTRRFIPFLF
jgi:protein-S-isoprenylcysteine O-methyltransferase Ste14